MRIADDTGRLWRAPEVQLDAAEIGLESVRLEYENRHLVAALWDRVSAPLPNSSSGLCRSVDRDRKFRRRHRHPRRGFAARDPARGRRRWPPVGLPGRGRDRHGGAPLPPDRPHLHSRPLPPRIMIFRQNFIPATARSRSCRCPPAAPSLVCVVAPAQAEVLARLNGGALDAEIERRCHSMLGKVQVERGHGAFALSVATASRLAAGRIALVGEAAHVFAPIGAQGLNLGLRDAVTYRRGRRRCLARRTRCRRGRCHGGIREASAVRRRQPRRRDRPPQPLAVVRFSAPSGTAGPWPLRSRSIGPLRRAVMREGIAPTRAMPLLMRGTA